MKAKTNVSKAKSRRGFTLVEMIVVIGMIAALAGISFPVYKVDSEEGGEAAVAMMYSVDRAAVIILRRSIIICHMLEQLTHVEIE